MQHKLAAVSKIAVLSLFASCAAPVLAQSAGSTVLNVGWAHITPNDSSTPLTITQPALGAIPDSGTGVSRTETLGIAINYFYTDNIVFAADLGAPPTYKLHGEGTLAGVGQIGTAKQWAPTVFVKYFFGEAKAKWRPYVGAGVTYVRYSDVELSSGFQQLVGKKFGSPAAVTTAELSRGFSPSINAGVSYQIDNNWYANLSLTYVDLKTDADLTTLATKVGTVKSSTTLTLNPIVAFAAVGYRF